MTLDRRSLLAAGLALGASQRATAAALVPNDKRDQTADLQRLIAQAAKTGAPILLPAGIFRVSDLRLEPGTKLIGAAGMTTLRFTGGNAFITAERAAGIVLDGLALDGGNLPFDAARADGLLTLSRCANLVIRDCKVQNSAGIGISLVACSGRISDCTVTGIQDAGIKALDSSGLTISNTSVSNCGDNGILVWRTTVGEDGTQVLNNRISHIRHSSGGTGQFGNGINVFRAGSVTVANNRVTDCDYTAIRANSASNVQITANSCERLGEVAIYAEFAFEGAVIANNLIDHAACGISVTNFNEGGRLAVIQGNLIRNLFRREFEKTDKRGEGIGVEADATVSGNTIEGAPTAGIQIGWGSYLRDVAATGNVIRKAGVGISVSGANGAGSCLIANNLISETRDGAIRTMDKGVSYGPDLGREPSGNARLSITGNLAV